MFFSKKIEMLVTAALFLFPLLVKDHANAQEPVEALSLDHCLKFEDVLELAARRDPTVLLARASEEEANAGIEDARSLFRPRLDAIGRTGFGSTGIVDSGVSNSLGFRASQRLLDFGDAKLARKSAYADFAATQNETRQAKINASLEVGLAYLEYYESLAQIDLTERRQDYFKTQLSSIDELLEGGGATLTERAAVASQLAEAEGFVLELQFRRNRAETRIRISTESRSGLCSQIQDDKSNLGPHYGTAETVVTDALVKNATLAALKNRAEGEAFRANREYNARLPVISAVATGAYSSVGGFDQFEFRDRIGIDVTVPIYSGNALRARKRRALARETAARARVLDWSRQLTEDVSVRWQRIESLKRQLKAHKEVEKQTQLQFEMAQIESGAGTITFRDLVELRLEFEQAALGRIRTEFALKREQFMMRSLIGHINDGSES